jgi:diguanylate cyclase (GGDEF)-like protein/PAS domain S-box-containing protein
MDKIFQGDSETVHPSHPGRAGPEPVPDEARHAQAVFILGTGLEFSGFNAAFIRTFSKLCNRAPLLHEPVSVLPFYAANLAGEEQGIEALCRHALDGSLLRAQGLLRLSDGDTPCCLEFIAAYDPCGNPATLVVTMLDIAARDSVAPLPGARDAGGPSWEKPGYESVGVSSQEFQTTFNLAAVGIAHVGLDGQWLRVNRQMCDMLGYTREELLATTFRAVSYPEDLDQDDLLLQEALEGKRSAYMLEKRYVRKDGSLTWAHLAVSLLRDQAGHPKYFISVVSDLNAQKTATAELEQSRARIKAIFDSLNEAVFVFEASGRLVEATPTGLRMFGYRDLKEVNASLGKITSLFDAYTLDGQVLPPNQWPVFRVLRGETIANIELELRRRDNGRRWFASFSGTHTAGLGEAAPLCVLTVRNVTKRHYAETALRVSEQRFRTAFDNIPDVVAIYDSQFRIRYVNHALTRLTQRPASSYIGRRDSDIAAPGLVALWRPLLHMARTTSSVQTSDLEYPSAKGTRYVIATSVPLLNAAGAVEEVMCIFHDFTERKLAEDKARQAALHDPLTHLPNRALLFEYAPHVLGGARRMRESVAFMFVDLDRFKPINDIHGHETGDEVLRQVAQRFTDNVREEDMVFRLGGDEFLILLPRIKDVSVASELALHILDMLHRPYRIGHLELTLSASLGISLYPSDGKEIDALINHADAAMYHAKQLGRNGYQFYSPEMSEQTEGQSVIEQQLRQAIAHNEFRLFYQPVVDVVTGEVMSLEALIRWPGKSAGPSRFVPIAEASGLIGPVGEWVFSEACRQYLRWRSEGLPCVPIAVNVSSVQFKRKGLVDYLVRMLAAYGLNSTAIQVELTETALMDDIEHAVKVLGGLKELGIKISLDDFGTGYSSLSYLSRLPLDKIKIDQSFVQQIQTDTAGRAITDAIIALGRTLGLEIVAEGIESEEVLTYLRKQGCHQAQGFHVCKPLSGDELATWYRDYLQQRTGLLPPGAAR